MIRSYIREKSRSGSVFKKILHPDLHSAEGVDLDPKKINEDDGCYSYPI
jgi:hypothetical protein